MSKIVFADDGNDKNVYAMQGLVNWSSYVKIEHV